MANDQDLFETPELIPAEIKVFFDDVEDEPNYLQLANIQKKCEQLGYTFDYYLDATPYNLRKF